MTSDKTWLITGASSGLGLEISLAALREGHRVIGTGRNISKASHDHPEFERLGGKWLQLDLARSDAQQILAQAVQEEEEEQRQSTNWVVINNAGYTLLGVVEDMSEEQIQTYLQTNLFGIMRVWKALLPALRRNRQGILVTVSSIWGFQNKAEHMMYSAVKAAQDSLTESYADLLASFGVRTIIIEAGGLRTPFAGNNVKADGGICKDYEDRMDKWIDIVDGAGRDPTAVNGDPKRFGERVLDAVECRGLFVDIWRNHPSNFALRVELGSDCHELHGIRLEQLNEGHAKMGNIACSTDVR